MAVDGTLDTPAWSAMSPMVVLATPGHEHVLGRIQDAVAGALGFFFRLAGHSDISLK